MTNQEKTEMDKIEEGFDEEFGFAEIIEDEINQAYITCNKIEMSSVDNLLYEVKLFYRKEIEELVKKLIPKEETAKDPHSHISISIASAYNICRRKFIENAKSLGINLD